MMAALYLIPSTLGEIAKVGKLEKNRVFPEYNLEIINSLDHFIVENSRSARRFLRSVGYSANFDEGVMFELSKHSKSEEKESMILPLLEGHDMGIISEAGAPAVADPGSDIVLLAHKNNIRVVPLIGPSSILLALMSSGMNGQKFTFHGYLPVKKNERIKAIKELEKTSSRYNETEIFMETPYRNMQLLEDIVSAASPSSLLCIACDITEPTEFIKTLPVSQWKTKLPDINKRPAIFLLHYVN